MFQQHWPCRNSRVRTPILTGSFVKAGLVTCFPKASSWNCSSCTTSPASVLLVGASAWMYCKTKSTHLLRRGKLGTAQLPPALGEQSFRILGSLCGWEGVERVLHRRSTKHKHFSSFRLKIQHSPVAHAQLLRAGSQTRINHSKLISAPNKGTGSCCPHTQSFLQ